MNNYYAPDSRWRMYQINNKEQFAEKLVIEGAFHDQVPEDVIKAYETVEYLMAHAYYHWPMYDEALHKVLLVIEMAIKLKAKQLKIPISTSKKNGKKWDRRLANIINDICSEDHLSDLKQKLDRSRELRNMQVHPKQNSFSGAMGGIGRNIKYCVNVLNRLFRGKEWHRKQQNEIANIQGTLSNFQNKLLVVERDKVKRVISSLLDFDVIENTLFIVGLPVLDVKKLKADNKEGILPDPVTFTFSNYKVYDDQMTGQTPETGEIKLFITECEELFEAYDRHKKYIRSSSSQDKRIYTDFMLMEIPWHLSNSEYQYLREGQKA